MRVGERIAELRTGAGLSQSELAQRTGVTRQAMSQIETGRSAPFRSTLEGIAAALGITLNQLLGYEPLPLEREQEIAAMTLCYLRMSRANQILIHSLCQQLALVPQEA